MLRTTHKGFMVGSKDACDFFNAEHQKVKGDRRIKAFGFDVILNNARTNWQALKDCFRFARPVEAKPARDQ